MSKSIVLTLDAWAKIHQRLARENHSSVMLIREKMKVVLGFTVRRHREFVRNVEYDYGHYVETIHLDFYSEPKRTMFLLKFSEYLDKSGNTTLD